MFNFFNKLKYTEHMFVGEFGELQKELTELALEIAKDFNLKLDFTHESIQIVEEILSEIHLEYIENGNTEGLQGIAFEFGCYIAAVIQKNTHTGELQKDHEEFGENTFPFYWREHTLFPYGWCEKRIFDGEVDNIWPKYNILVLEKI